jgi:tRNA-Thr(GGU) m(6)t(6)A37 methyltransferase TsaA
MSQQHQFTLNAIAVFRCSKKQTLEASSQGTLDPNSQGSIDLSHLPQSSEMLQGLEGFSHLWIIFIFHQTEGHWKPMVWPPRAERKVGVFASRSPHRPSPIGMTAVKIEKIEGPKIWVLGHDLIDGTPILDIKPYLAYADSFPDSTHGWVEHAPVYDVQFNSEAKAALQWLNEHGLTEFTATLQQQLRFHPTDHRRKRVKPLKDTNPSFLIPRFQFAYRTWRALFEVNESTTVVNVLKIYSGYSPEELTNTADPYEDKELHRQYLLDISEE